MYSTRRAIHGRPVIKVPSLPLGCPPLLLETDEKVLVFLRGIRARGGAINNNNIVHETVMGLLDSAGRARQIDTKDTNEWVFTNIWVS